MPFELNTMGGTPGLALSAFFANGLTIHQADSVQSVCLVLHRCDHLYPSTYAYEDMVLNTGVSHALQTLRRLRGIRELKLTAISCSKAHQGWISRAEWVLEKFKAEFNGTVSASRNEVKIFLEQPHGIGG